MPRPKTKPELLSASQQNFDRLDSLVDSFSEEEQKRDFPSGTMNRNIRDVLAHLHDWHLMMLRWYDLGMAGEKPDMPAKGFSWKDTPKLNQAIWEKHQSVDLAEVRKLLEKSHRDVHRLVEAHTDEELFEKKRYPWTGSTSLGAYLVSSTSSHYDWAYKLIKKAKR